MNGQEIPTEVNLPKPDNPNIEAARKAIMATVRSSCGVSLTEALTVQSNHSADFMISDTCRKGMIGVECNKIMAT